MPFSEMGYSLGLESLFLDTASMRKPAITFITRMTGFPHRDNNDQTN